MRDLLAEDEARSGRVALVSQREARSGSSISTSTLKDPTQELIGIFGATTRSGAKVSDDTAFNVSTVRSCINFRANLRAMLPVKLFKNTPGGPEEQRDHPVSKLLRGRVGPAQNTFQWRHYDEVCTCLGGNGYRPIRRDTFADVRALEFWKPSETEPRILDSGRLIYRNQRTGETLQDYEMLHNRGLSTNGLTGRSPLFDLRETVGLAMTAQAFAAATFNNGNRQPGIFKGPATWDRPKAQEFLKFFQENYATAANAGKPMAVFGGMEWAAAGFSLQDAELLMSRKFDVEEIARVYGVPLHMIGSTEKATTWGSGIEQLNRGLVDYVITPMVRGDEIEMTDKLLSEREKDDGFYIRYALDALLRGSPQARAQFYEIMRRIGAMDVNQIRTLEDMPLYPDGWAGDPRQPLNAQQSGQGVAGKPDPANEPAAAASE